MYWQGEGDKEGKKSMKKSIDRGNVMPECPLTLSLPPLLPAHLRRMHDVVASKETLTSVDRVL